MDRLPRRLILGSVFALPIVAATIDHGASTIFYLLALVGLVVGWPARRQLEPGEKRILWGWVAIFVAAALTVLVAEDFRGYRRQLGHFKLFPLTVPIYLAFRRFAGGCGPWWVAGLAVSGFVSLAVAVYDVGVSGLERATGAYHYILLGVLTALAIVALGCYLITVARRPAEYALALAGMAAAAGACVLSATRIAWLFFPTAGLLLVWLVRDRIGRRGWLAIAVLTIVGGVGALATPQVAWRVRDTVNDLQMYREDPTFPTSTGERLSMWRDATAMFVESPVLGVGIGDFGLRTERRIAAGESYMQEIYTHAHNLYLHALATTGVVGTVPLLAGLFVLPWMAFAAAWRRDARGWAGFGALAGLTQVLCLAVLGIATPLLSNPMIIWMLIAQCAQLTLAYRK